MWANSLAKRGIDIIVYSFTEFDPALYDDTVNIKTYSLGMKRNIQLEDEKAPGKINYLRSVIHLKKIIRKEKPDILHAHYASSYGLVGALTGFHPFIVSVWGTDILSFPMNSALHNKIIKFNLLKADKILATGNYLARETSRYTNKKITVTPFGVDTENFYPRDIKNKFNNSSTVIGTIKRLEKFYGINYLLEAFKILKEKYPGYNLKLIITGDGNEKEALKSRAKKLRIADDVLFTGYVSPAGTAEYYNMMDIVVIPSLRESFGVAAIEAGACARAAVVTNVGGLPEIVINNETGLIVPPADTNSLAGAIEILINNISERKRMGTNARKRIEQNFGIGKCTDKMISVYNELYPSQGAD